MTSQTPNLNKNLKVRNVANTSKVWQGDESWKRVCKCKTWMDHWRAGVLFYFPNAHPEMYLEPPCYVEDCNGRGTEGAHVVEVDGRATRYWKIVPFCKKHNNHRFSDEVFLKVDAILIPANQVDTCKSSEDWKEAYTTIMLHKG